MLYVTNTGRKCNGVEDTQVFYTTGTCSTLKIVEGGKVILAADPQQRWARSQIFKMHAGIERTNKGAENGGFDFRSIGIGDVGQRSRWTDTTNV